MTETARLILDAVRILQIREILRTVYEVCATAQARFDDQSQTMTVHLDSFIRRFELTQPGVVLRPPWLPKRDTVKVILSADEGPAAAKEIFDDWTERVRQRIPAPSEWRSDIGWLHPDHAGSEQKAGAR